MVKFSIIVPVYNTMEYLKACLTSILHQSYKNFEVIVVNDGSSDDSHVVLEYYQKNYPGVTLIHQENGGLSHSRNVGLAKASGEYILFLDSDDAFIPNCLEDLAKFLDETQPDVSVCNWMSYHKGKTLEYYEYFAAKKLKTIPTSSGRDFIHAMLKKDKSWELYTWNMVYRHDFLKEHGFKFVEQILFEDMIWNWQVLLKAKKVNYYPYHIVLYTRKREGQITRQVNVKSVLSRLYVSNYWLEHVDRYRLTVNEKYYFMVRIANLYFSAVFLVGALKPQQQEVAFEQLERGRELLNYAPNAFMQSIQDMVKRVGFRKTARIIGKKSVIFFQL